MKKCKVYKDGSHYIAIRPTTGYSGVRRKPPPEEPIVVEEVCEESEQAVADAEIKPQEDMAEEQVKAEKDEPYCPQEEAPAKNYRVSTRSEEFLRLYRESFGTSRKKQYEYIASGLAPYFQNEDELRRYVDRKMECKKRAEMTRRIRCLRRASLHELSYFATMT